MTQQIIRPTPIIFLKISESLLSNKMIKVCQKFHINNNKMNSLVDIDGLTDHLVRPPKFTYSLSDLGDSVFELDGIIYERLDFLVYSQEASQRVRLNASIWRRRGEQDSNGRKQIGQKIMIYMHCNCGSRVEALQILKNCLRSGNSLVAFDSRACGHSEGHFISLGFHQAIDLQAVISHVKNNFAPSPSITLWGRSMGAVAILTYLTKFSKYQTSDIALAVLDSPFINLSEVICETINNRTGAPKILVDLFLSYLQPKIQQKARFKISQFDLRSFIRLIECPLILMASKSDGVVPFSHLEEIYNKHEGRKTIFYLKQTHIEQRSSETISKVFKAIDRYQKFQGKMMYNKETQRDVTGLKRTKNPSSSSDKIFTTPPQAVQGKQKKQQIYSHRVSENVKDNKLVHQGAVNSGRKKLSLTCCTKSLGRLQLMRNSNNFKIEEPAMIIDILSSKRNRYTEKCVGMNSEQNFIRKHSVELNQQKTSVKSVGKERLQNKIKTISIKKPQSTPTPDHVPQLNKNSMTKNYKLVTQMVKDYLQKKETENIEELEHPFNNEEQWAIQEKKQKQIFPHNFNITVARWKQPLKSIKLTLNSSQSRYRKQERSPSSKRLTENKAKEEPQKTMITLTKKNKTQQSSFLLPKKDNNIRQQPLGTNRKLSINQKTRTNSIPEREIKVITMRESTRLKENKNTSYLQSLQQKLRYLSK